MQRWQINERQTANRFDMLVTINTTIKEKLVRLPILFFFAVFRYTNFYVINAELLYCMSRRILRDKRSFCHEKS